MIRRFLWLPGTVLAAVLGLIVASPAQAAPPTGLAPVYLALGDSIAAGVGAVHPAETGYVSLLAETLRRDASCGPGHSGQGTGHEDGCPELDLRNLAVGGATTESLTSSQLGPALALLRERNANGSPRDDVRFVTITIGGNDIFIPIITNCFADPIPPRSPTCVATIDRVLDSYEANLDRILRDLREAAGRHTTIVVTGYDNPLPACVLAHLTVLGNDVLEDDDLPGFNDRTAIVAARYGVEMANAFRRLGAGQMVGGSDCQHPNQEGHATYAAVVAEAILG